MSLGFLTPGGPTPRSPLGSAATLDGWQVAAPIGDPARVLVEDISPLRKVETTPPAGVELGTATRAGDVWTCPITPARALVLGDPSADGLDVTGLYAALAISGPQARELFARFCALDLRDRAMPVGAFRPGSVARTPGFVLRADAERWIVLVGAAYGPYVWEVIGDARPLS